MKKKISAYTAIAILLGVAMMMLPQTLIAGQSRYPTSSSPDQYANNNRAPTGETNTFQSFWATQLSVNFLPISLIVIVGLIVALTSYVLLRKRIG